ncbi:hypothetical protein CXF72_13445 [Psychromonas sp. MB-3u-54]|uniref:DUF6488 family protein n=1 Tax=Psychromonas sp. MB-3u-54 TaxID=2058319 RepID=UPI000C33E4E8|nr:DUF6488 family protein [Psychromonas sp. MB-3u-54]PKH02116.1 hypothetical protein CXF72_13445 [Psychromonas sp. MB-3u-54]
MFKSIITTVVITITMFLSTAAYSSAGHSHGPSTAPSNEQIISKAFQDLSTIVNKSELVEGQALNESWKEVTDKKIQEKSLRYYIVAFTNTVEKKTLYILLNSKGTYMGVNFNGKFEKL